MTLADLTFWSTTCIVLSGVTLLCGWFFIRVRHDVALHRNTMLAAATFAALFLVLYVTRWSLYGSKHFTGQGLWRIVYFSNLVPHIIFAMLLGPLVLRLLYLALRKRDFRAHKRLARYVLPMWLYVAVSGWLIFYMLYGRTY